MTAQHGRSASWNRDGASGVYSPMAITTTSGVEPMPPEEPEPPYPAADPGALEGTALDFSDFYREHWTAVARALTLTTGNPELAAEATDEAMARAYAHWAKVSRYDNPAGWVYRVGLNWTRSLHRRISRTLPSRPAPAQPDIQVADPAIRAALLDLDVKHRAVVVCRLLLDWSVDETSEALGVRPGTVKSRLSRALALLHATLAHLGDPS